MLKIKVKHSLHFAECVIITLSHYMAELLEYGISMARVRRGAVFFSISRVHGTLLGGAGVASRSRVHGTLLGGAGVALRSRVHGTLLGGSSSHHVSL